MPTNLLAWDGASRLYFWDSNKHYLHRVSVRLGEPESTTILAASPSKALQADADLDFDLYRISINRTGSALLLSGLEGLCVMYLYGRSSPKENTIICWIFNLSSDLDQPEREYYLQPIEPGALHNVSSIFPVGFSFEVTICGIGSAQVRCPPPVKSTALEELKDIEGATIISKDLLGGPKAVLLLQSSANIRSIASDSIHQYFKLFHANYLEYAHKVHFELQHHAPRLKEIADDLHFRLRKVDLKVSHVEENQEKIKNRIDHARQIHGNLEMRLCDLRHLPGAHKKPLSKPEQDFKSELGACSCIHVYIRPPHPLHREEPF